jgi:pimeloyl-ACP methyl ester carboxylesterase
MRREISPGFRISFSGHGDPNAEPLVLVGGAGSTKDSWGALPGALAAGYRVICFDCRGLSESDRGAGTLSMAAVAVFSPELLDAPEYGTLVEQLKPTLPRDDAQIATTIAQWDASLGHDTTALLPEITAPVLVVAGEQDGLAPPRYGRQVTDLVPRSRFVLFEGPGSSHAVGLERMGEFSALVMDFLAQHLCVAAS